MTETEARPALSPREREVAWLAAELSTEEIAVRLGISFHTVRTHLVKAKAKLGVTKKRDLPGALRSAGVPEPGA